LRELVRFATRSIEWAQRRQWTTCDLTDDNLQVPIADLGLTDEDIQRLLALRSAAVRRASSPPLPPEATLRLGAMGYAYTSGTGGAVISDAGIALLEGHFLFCRATGCDGVLRRWTYLPGGAYAGCHPDDPDIQRNKAGGYYLKCPKCGSFNLLGGEEQPTRVGDYEVLSVITPR
jgi:hypothetical protein